ncbi:hypothetical protein KC19_2G195700 [Ceratodon purpureus]|uniref:Uncharacterized protein n=1 Tax=Ceratodon purpureus TaxID=3225 RepID=A0A8T0IXC9_CERPU|nr:hypothetical protein KC19_2G195700 [Ceratodon purpureus]
MVMGRLARRQALDPRGSTGGRGHGWADGGEGGMKQAGVCVPYEHSMRLPLSSLAKPALGQPQAHRHLPSPPPPPHRISRIHPPAPPPPSPPPGYWKCVGDLLPVWIWRGSIAITWWLKIGLFAICVVVCCGICDYASELEA